MLSSWLFLFVGFFFSLLQVLSYPELDDLADQCQRERFVQRELHRSFGGF